MNKISFDVNNGGILSLEQENHDGAVLLSDGTKISAGDFVMLINYYRHVKNNDIQNNFINYHGKNKEA